MKRIIYRGTGGIALVLTLLAAIPRWCPMIFLPVFVIGLMIGPMGMM